jgi:hypothetical protein
VLVAIVAFRLVSETSISAPAGWSDVVRTACPTRSNPLSQAIFVRAATSAEPDQHTFSFDSPTGAVGSILAYDGVDVGQPVAVSAGRMSRSSKGIGATITTTAPQALLVGAFAHNGTSTISPPAGMATRTSAATAAGAPTVRGLTADQLLTSAGTYTRTAETPTANVCNVAQLVALKPAPNSPTNLDPPVVSGTAVDGQVLNATTGSWSGSPTAYAYRWERCSESGADCAAVPGATSASYGLTLADVGSRLRVVVTASNSEGSTSAPSAPTAVVAPINPPTSTAPPVISGAAREGDTLAVTTGTWSGSPTGFTFQWERCDVSACAPIAGATSSTYVVQSPDVGYRARALVTASNAAGSTTVASAATAVVVPPPPANTTPPTVTGTPRLGATLTASTGSWSGAPTGFTFQWERCDAQVSACTAIDGAIAEEYFLTPADLGSRVRVVVAASNAGGTVSAASAATSIVVPEPPANLTPPTIAGTPRESEPLLADPGSWSGSPTVYAYQWQRSTDGGSSWIDLSSSGPTYVPVSADVGAILRVTVTASNAGGSTSAASAETPQIAPAAVPAPITAPAITGIAQEGGELTASEGTWTGSPSSFEFQWERCSPDVLTCEAIVDADSSTYTAVADDIGLRLRVAVSATNAAGTGVSESAPTAAVLMAAPKSTSAPLVTGPGVEGADLTATNGDWSGSPTAYQYLWYRCDPNGDSCSPITWADVAWYRLRPQDVGGTVRIQVTASNAGGSSAAMSSHTEVVVPLPPVNNALPVVSGVLEEGESVAVTPGDWASAGPLTYGYQWQRSTDGGATWLDIGGADDPTYELAAADVGFVVRAVVTAANAGGSASVASAATAPISSPGLPVNNTPPTFSGVVQSGRSLTAVSGTWSGDPTAFAYRWQSSSDQGQTWTDIGGATSSLYTLTASNVGAEIRVLVTAFNVFGSRSAPSPSLTVHPAGNNLVVLANQPWRCATSVALDLVKVTLWTRDTDAIVLAAGCTGRVGRLEATTYTQDAIKTQNAAPNAAHDFSVDSGYAECLARTPGAHQDGWQNMGGARITIRNFVWDCGDMNDSYGSGVAQAVVIGQAGQGVTVPTDIVVEHSVIMPGAAHTFALFNPNLRSGIRNSVLCPDRTPSNGVFEADATSLQVVNEGNEAAALEDPRCTSLAAALAWVQSTG